MVGRVFFLCHRVDIVEVLTFPTPVYTFHHSPIKEPTNMKSPTPSSSKSPRSIERNLAVTTTYVQKAIAHDRVVSGGVGK
jgi:hypothetical protein